MKSNENIKKLDEKIAQLQARKKTEENKLKQKAKAERQKRLIKLGEVAEKYNFATPEELEEFLKKGANMFAEEEKKS